MIGARYCRTAIALLASSARDIPLGLRTAVVEALTATFVLVRSG